MATNTVRQTRTIEINGVEVARWVLAPCPRCGRYSVVVWADEENRCVIECEEHGIQEVPQ